MRSTSGDDDGTPTSGNDDGTPTSGDDTEVADRYTAGPRTTPEARPVSRTIVAVAIAIPLILLLVALVWVRRLGGETTDPQADRSAPAAVASVPAPQAASAECRAFVDALPDTLGGARRVAMVEPAPAGAAAYRPSGGGAVEVIRCGLDAPGDFVVGSALQQVDRVQWFRQTDEDTPAAGAQTSTWFAVDRSRYVAVTLDRDAGSATIQELSTIVADTLAERTPTPAPAR